MQYIVSNSQKQKQVLHNQIRQNIAPFWDFVVVAEAEILSRLILAFKVLNSVQPKRAM